MFVYNHSFLLEQRTNSFWIILILSMYFEQQYVDVDENQCNIQSVNKIKMYFTKIKNSPSKSDILNSNLSNKIPPLMKLSKSNNKLSFEQEKPHEVSRVLMLENSLVESEIVVEPYENVYDVDEEHDDRNEFMEMDSHSSRHMIKTQQKQTKKEQLETPQFDSPSHKKDILQVFEETVMANNSEIPFLEKNSSQLLFSILSNPEKLKLFINYLQTTQIQQKLKQSQAHKNIDILICLLVKLSKCHIEVALSSQLNKNSFKLNFSTPQDQKNSEEKNKQIRKRRNQILEKDKQIYEIKNKYDEVVNDYALSISNLSQQKKIRQETEEKDEEYMMESSKPLTFYGMSKASRQGSIFNEE